MAIAVIYGGSRANGNTELLTERAIEGLSVERIYLREHTIKPVEDLRHTDLGFPDVNDDYNFVIDRVMGHGTLLFATPIYWYGMSGYMKNFIDRWSQTLRDSNRPDFRDKMSTMNAYVIAVGGDSPSLKGLPLIQQFQFIFDFVGASFGGYILGSGNKPGEVLHDSNAILLADQLRDRLKHIH
jgi:multimeric flavodoxin WrbA